MIKGTTLLFKELTKLEKLHKRYKDETSNNLSTINTNTKALLRKYNDYILWLEQQILNN